MQASRDQRLPDNLLISTMLFLGNASDGCCVTGKGYKFSSQLVRHRQSFLPTQCKNGGVWANVEERKIENRELRHIRILQKEYMLVNRAKLSCSRYCLTHCSLTYVHCMQPHFHFHMHMYEHL